MHRPVIGDDQHRTLVRHRRREPVRAALGVSGSRDARPTALTGTAGVLPAAADAAREAGG
jgi:hypothetical protein